MVSCFPTDEMDDILNIRFNIQEEVGDCSNLEIKVNPDSIFWNTVSKKGGLTLQKNCLLPWARIVDSHRIQKANGSLQAMEEKLARLTSTDFLRAGDVIGVSRGIYEHYAIYAGGGKVIHYSLELDNSKSKISIHEDSLENFLENGRDYFVVSFKGSHPIKIHRATKFISNGSYDCGGVRLTEKYSPRETLRRARSRIGECKYSIITNNCEHFAMWCKTGKSESTQVSRIAKYVLNTRRFDGIAESRKDIVAYLGGE